MVMSLPSPSCQSLSLRFRDRTLVELAERDIVHRDLAAVCIIVRRVPHGLLRCSTLKSKGSMSP
jgi:hypothetical protein